MMNFHLTMSNVFIVFKKLSLVYCVYLLGYCHYAAALLNFTMKFKKTTYLPNFKFSNYLYSIP